MNTKVNYEAFAKEMSEALKTPEDRIAVAAKIVKYISDGFEQSDLSSLVLPKENIPVGTTAEYALPGKLKAYWHEPGSYAPRTSMVQKVFTVPTWMVSTHPEYEISQLEAGRYGTAQDQIKAAKEAITGAVNARVFNTLIGSIATTDSNYYATAGSAGLTKSALDQAVSWVEDQVGGAKAIIGRRNLFDKLLDWNLDTSAGDLGLYSDEMKNQIIKTGKIRLYRGIPIIALPQWRDGFGKMTIPQDEVLVVGDNVGKYVINQELRAKEAIDVDTLVWHIHLYMKMGAAVFFPKRMARIKISA